MMTYGPMTLAETPVMLALGAAAAFSVCLFSFKRRGRLLRAATAFLFTLCAYRVAAIIFLPLLLNAGTPPPVALPWSMSLGFSLGFDISDILGSFGYHLSREGASAVWFMLFAFFGTLLFPRLLRRPLSALAVIAALDAVYIAYNTVQNNVAQYPIETVTDVRLMFTAAGYFAGWVAARLFLKAVPRLDETLGNGGGKR